MHLDSKSLIAGIPAIQVRDFLKPLHNCQWTKTYMAHSLNLSEETTEGLIRELLRLGYIEESEWQLDERHYQRTLAGSTFSLASAAPPLTRKTAERKLGEFLERVHAVNANNDFVYCVRKVLVFGSYLTERERINDIDVAIELAFRDNDRDKREAAIRARIDHAYRRGRYFRSFVEELEWPYKEVLLFLKSRSRAISLHTTDDAILRQAQSRIVFQDDLLEEKMELTG